MNTCPLARRAEGVPGLELGGVTHGGRSQWAGPGDDAQHIVVGRGGIAWSIALAQVLVCP